MNKNLFTFTISITFGLLLFIAQPMIIDNTVSAWAGGDGGPGGCCGGPGEGGDITSDPDPDPPGDPDPDPIYPYCDISANPNDDITPGDSTSLTWSTTNAVTAHLQPLNQSVSTGSNQSRSVTVNQDTTYTLTVTSTTGHQNSCSTSVETTTSDPNPSDFTCDDITFSANDTSLPKGGGDVTFSWNAANADTVSIDALNTTAKTGTKTIDISRTTTYTLNATKDSDSISCPVKVSVDTGGGGGTLKPLCWLKVDDDELSKGESTTLQWTTANTKEVEIVDNHDDTLLDSRNKDDHKGTMTIKPTKDTTYTLTATYYSRSVECDVSVDVDGKSDGVTVFETRNQQPTVAGIALTNVPYTGFEAGPVLTTIFYTMLALWGLFVAYVLVVRSKHFAGISLPSSHGHAAVPDVTTDEAVDSAGISEAEAYVAQTVHAPAPSNLPTGATPTVGYANRAETTDTDEMSELENQAHEELALFSSDAMRYFMEKVNANRSQELSALITKAKTIFPSENGWVVINQERIEQLLGADKSATAAVAADVSPTTAGSLAEAMAMGNVVAAYQMIAHRPMIALADAAAELDTVLRQREANTDTTVSTLLADATRDVDDEQLRTAISALTSALDGVYTDEAEAVKMAILKAVKALSS